MQDCEQDYIYYVEEDEDEQDEQDCEIAEELTGDHPPLCFGFEHGMLGSGGRRHRPPSMWGPFGEEDGHPHHHANWGKRGHGHSPYMHGHHRHHPHGPHAHHPHGPHQYGPHPHGPPGCHTHGPHDHHHHQHGPPPPPMFGAFKRGGRGRGKSPWRRSRRAHEEQSSDDCCKTGSVYPGCECGAAGGKSANDIFVYVHDFAPEEIQVKIFNDKLTVTAAHVQEQQQRDDVTKARRESMTHVYQLPSNENVDRRGIKGKLVCRGRFLHVKMPYKNVQVPIEDDNEAIPEMEGLVITKD